MINNNNQNIGIDLQLGNGLNFENLNEINENKNNEGKDVNSNKLEYINLMSNPYLEKIKLYKENLKIRINIENSLLGDHNIKYDEKKHLSNFSSGAVEYGLPCEAVNLRSIEVFYFF